MSEGDPHYLGHRQRLRERFLKSGLDGFSDYEVVELLLTLAVPRSDVKQPAKALIARFGNLRGILDAPIEELQAVRGLGSVTPVALKIVRAAATLYLQQSGEGQDSLADPSRLADFWRMRIGALRNEVFQVGYLDSGYRLLRDGIETLEEGTTDRAAVYPRSVVESALRRGAAALVLAHSHPNGHVMPSDQDRVIDRAKLPNRFAELYPAVRDYVGTRCFGRTVDLENEALRSHLSRLELQEGLAKYLARKIAELTVERRAIEFDKADFRLSETRPFSWRRNLPPLAAKRTVFNYVATYNDYERRFAVFLDKAGDLLRFASLGTTEQGESGTRFRVDYVKPSGAVGFYHPDWVVVQKTTGGETNWIIETKGRVWEGTTAKDDAIKDWCKRVSEATGSTWRYTRIDQIAFDARKPTELGHLLT